MASPSSPFPPESSAFPDFAVACGEETSDPTVLHDGAVVRVDELAASDHLAHQDRDLADVAALGVQLWRYGMPWPRTEIAPGEYDWQLWDRALAACDRAGLTPVVDLCHFGLPDHLGGFCSPEWVPAFERYVAAFLERYREPVFFTPVNEPMITSMCSGFLGFWNDRRASRADYMTALANVTLANLTAVEQIRADRDGWWIGAEGFGCHVAATPEDQQAADDARALEQLVWDLHLGVEPRGSVADVVEVVEPSVLRRIDELAGTATKVVAGHDLGGGAGQLVDASQHRRLDHLYDIGHRPAWFDAEVQVPHQLLERPGVVRCLLVLGRRGDVATEPLGTDPPAVAISADLLDGGQVGERDVRERRHVVRT